ncbi:hypothetical protein ACQKNC_11330 [Lysinibacillus sp. NPDC094177]|uniref:hypothetical protein n=1 Tax=Lysinibacillus sp. NPDC094177 TaxID=3390580 RepID=UPI003CFED0DB
MKKRTLTQVMAHKAIYRKHATAYKLNDYPVHRAKRMMAYTSLLTRAIALTGSR